MVLISFFHLGIRARESYEIKRREAAAIKIQKTIRGYLARKLHVKTRISTVVLQAGIRAMIARCEYRHRRRQVKAAIVIQVSSWMFNQLVQCFIAFIIAMPFLK